MNACVAHILTALVLIHTLCGCCPSSAAARLTGISSTHGCSCCDSTDAGTHTDHGAPGKGKTQHRCELCAYLATPRVDLDQSVVNFVTWLNPLALEAPLATMAPCGRLSLEPPVSAAPRLHLTLQILLI